MATKSFIEVLEEQIRTDLRREIEAEVRREIARESAGGKSASSSSGFAHQESPVPTEWLISRLGKTFFSASTAKRNAYPHKATQAAPAPKKPSEPRRLSPTTLEEICALELIRRTSGISVSDSYTEVELKTAWRKAARKTHPDLFAQADQVTQMRMSVLFRELAEAFEFLQAGFDAPDTQQAA